MKSALSSPFYFAKIVWVCDLCHLVFTFVGIMIIADARRLLRMVPLISRISLNVPFLDLSTCLYLVDDFNESSPILLPWEKSSGFLKVWIVHLLKLKSSGFIWSRKPHQVSLSGDKGTLNVVILWDTRDYAGDAREKANYKEEKKKQNGDTEIIIYLSIPFPA